MASSFFERIDFLSDQIGEGTISGHVEVDQVYAKYQHEGVNRFTGGPLVYHEGGGDHFLRNPLFEGSGKRMEKLAARAITPGGSELRDAMIDATEDLVKDVYAEAPFEFGDLKASGHPKVIDNGAVIHDRPPNVGRLSKDELRAKNRVRSMFRFDRRP